MRFCTIILVGFALGFDITICDKTMLTSTVPPIGINETQAIDIALKQDMVKNGLKNPTCRAYKRNHVWVVRVSSKNDYSFGHFVFVTIDNKTGLVTRLEGGK